MTFDIGQPTLSQTCVDYLAVLKEMCGEETHAYAWLTQVIQVALVWDHLHDGDPVGEGAVDQIFTILVTEWPRNPFLRKYSDYLMPAVAASISAWKHTDNRDLHYSVYREVPAAVAFILGGSHLVDRFMPRISELVLQMRREDDFRDSQGETP